MIITSSHDLENRDEFEGTIIDLQVTYPTASPTPSKVILIVENKLDSERRITIELSHDEILALHNIAV